MINYDKDLMISEIFENIMYITSELLSYSKGHLLHAIHTNFFLLFTAIS